VPGWAYLEVSYTFNLSAAHADVGAPESTYGAPSTVSPTATSTSTQPTSISASSVSTIASASASASSTATVLLSSGVNAGAIVGGVIGGLLVIALFAGFMSWLYLRKRKQRRLAPSQAYPSSQPASTTRTVKSTTYDPPMTTRSQHLSSLQPLQPLRYQETDDEVDAVSHSGSVYPSQNVQSRYSYTAITTNDMSPTGANSYAPLRPNRREDDDAVVLS